MSIELFEESFKSEHTKKAYVVYLKKYGLDKLSVIEPKIAEEQIIKFILKLKREGKQYTTIENYVKAVIHYYRINDVVLNTKKISMYVPEPRRARKDRAYTHEEISKMLEIADERMRAILLLLSSSGIRIGAVPDLRLRDLKENVLTVYEGFKEEYLGFITPECMQAIDNYLDMRIRYGERLSDKSFLIREQFDIRDKLQIMKPRQIGSDAIRWMITDIAKRCGVRGTEVPIAHGFRKFYTTQLINSKINPEIREMLLGHKIGLASSYYRPTQDEMYAEYEKAVDALTINEENRLKKKIEILTIEKSRLDILEEKFNRIEMQSKRNRN